MQLLLFVLTILSIIASSLANETCWGEKLGYPCCPDTNCKIFYVNDDGNWGFHKFKWCAIDKEACETKKKLECWAEKLGFKCCPQGICEVSEKDENGAWSIYEGEWCGIIKSLCPNQI